MGIPSPCRALVKPPHVNLRQLPFTTTVNKGGGKAGRQAECERIRVQLKLTPAHSEPIRRRRADSVPLCTALERNHRRSRTCYWPFKGRHIQSVQAEIQRLAWSDACRPKVIRYGLSQHFYTAPCSLPVGVRSTTPASSQNKQWLHCYSDFTLAFHFSNAL